MKKITTYLLQFAGAMMLCTAMASCQQDLLQDDDPGTLPPGSHPVEFVATVGSMKTRSEGKNCWKNDDQIGIRTINLKGRKYSMIGCYSLNDEGMIKDVVQRYSVAADGTWNKLDREPLEWPYPQGRVSAWYPFDPQVDVPMDNQAEKGFDHLDFLSVTTDVKQYSDVVELMFEHQMAKVTCNVVPGDGITADEFDTLWLRLQGHTSCTFRETELTGGPNIGWITPDSTRNYTDGATYEALLVPNKMEGKDLISIGLKTNYEGQIIPKGFSYPSPEIKAGMHYVYNITVKKDRIEVSFFSVEWNDVYDGQRDAAKFTFRVNLTDELVNTINTFDSKAGEYVINKDLVVLSDNVTPIKNMETKLYDKLDILGNEFTLSIGGNKDTRSKDLVLTKNEATNTPIVVNQTHNGTTKYYIKNNIFLIADETTIGYADKLNVGDYFFSDGSWSSVLGWPDVTCVGIVFAVNKSDDLSVFKLTEGGPDVDTADNYNYIDTDGSVNPIYTSRRIRGYVLALEDTRRWDNISVSKTLKKDDQYNAGTLEYDTRVDVTAASLKYNSGTEYPAGTLPYNVKMVIGTDTTLYLKGTAYPAGRLTRSVTIIVDAETSVYPKGTSYPAGKLITSLTVTSLNVPKKVVEFAWTPFTGQNVYIGEVCSSSTDLFNGFANMVSVKSNIGKKMGNQTVPAYDKLEAFAASEGYAEFCQAPEGTSGWYLPSINQLDTALQYICQFNANLSDSPIVKAGGAQPNGDYWSSTIAGANDNSFPGYYAYYFNTQQSKTSKEQIVVGIEKYVRSVFTF